MTTQISSFYHQHAMEYAVVSEDGLTVTLPSEKEVNVTYEVRCKHTAKGMEAVSCQCRGFSRWGHCKHLTIVQEWQDAHYVEPRITEIEPNAWYILNKNTQVWRTEDGRWLAVGPTANAIQIVEAHLAVKAAEQIVASPKVVEVPDVPVVEARKVVKPDQHYVMSEAVYAKLAAMQDTRPKVAQKIETFKKEWGKPTRQKEDWGDLGERGNLTTSRAFSLMR